MSITGCKINSKWSLHVRVYVIDVFRAVNIIITFLASYNNHKLKHNIKQHKYCKALIATRTRLDPYTSTYAVVRNLEL